MEIVVVHQCPKRLDACVTTTANYVSNDVSALLTSVLFTSRHYLLRGLMQSSLSLPAYSPFRDALAMHGQQLEHRSAVPNDW